MSETLNLKSGSHRSRSHLPFTVYVLLLTACCLLLSARGPAQSEVENLKSQIENPGADVPPPGDWASELLDAMLSSPNEEAHDALYRAAFAAGPAIVPQLEAALKDDRTAEFAAQSLAFIGGAQALEILAKLTSDRRDLDLRRFYYGALGEFGAPEATAVLVDAIRRADQEPDRTVTEAAIVALTARSDAGLAAALRQALPRIADVVIRDDLENALDVIELRARYLSTLDGKNSGESIEQAVRTYFIPALEAPTPPAATSAQLANATAANGAPAPKPRVVGATRRTPARLPATRAKSPATPAATAPAAIKVEVRHLTFSPDKQRALARVVFEDPEAYANYDMVLEKQFGNWTIASVWLGAEAEKAPAKLEPQPKPN